MDVMENTERQQEELVNKNYQPVIQPEDTVQMQSAEVKPKINYNLDDYAREDGENIFDYISRVGKEKAEEYRNNVDRYTIRLRPEEYQLVNDVINSTPNVQENSYKVAAAMKYSKLYEIPLEEAYENLDQLNYSIFGEEANKGYTKNFWNTLCDMLQLGQNTVDIGMIGGQLREAIDTGNTERADELRELYAKYKEQNDFLQQNLPQNLAMKIVESGAQSFPFTMGAIGMSVVSPVTGFTYSAGVMAGQEYMDLTEQGASHETAKGVSTVVGAINGIVEIELGNVAGALGARAAGSKGGELLRKNVIDKITKNVAEKMHYSGGWRIVANVLSRNAMENLEEGAEEAVQETFSLLGRYIANEIDDLGIEGMTAQEIVKDLGENFMGGVYGSILLGSGTLITNSVAAKADYDAVKTAAEVIPSEKSFTKAVENSPVFEEMSEETKAQTIHEIYQKFGSKRDADLQKKAESLSEVISADEGMERYEAETDENGNELEAPEVPAETRDENGRLFSQQEELKENADGTYSGKKVYGDATKENNNQYGYISYTVNEETGTVTIDDFKTNEYRQYLNNEMFADFASEMADYDIQWNPTMADAKKWKADIEALNPSGKENGLNYFSTKNQTAESKADQQTRQRLVRELSQKFNLNGEEKALTVAMVEAMAKSQGKSVSEWISEKFQDSGIMGNIADLEEAARQESIKQGKEIRATGGMTLIDTVKGVKAVIYAAEGADLSTALHEFSHVWTKGLSGDLEAEAANVFGATQNKDGSYNWDAPVTLASGKTVSAYENLAYSYEKWLETGKAPTPQHENIFRKFAEFMKNCVKTLRSAVKLTPETEDFFNKYFNVTEGMLKNAENAVIAETENITKSGENLTNEVDAIPTEELLKAFEENNKEETPAESAVKETKLDPVTQEAVASILEDPAIPEEKKVAAVMKANGEAFIMKQDNIEYYKNRADLTEEERAQAVKDLEENNDSDHAGTGIPNSLLDSGKSMLFQIIGEKGAKALDEANEETIRMDNKAIAEEMEAAGKDAKSIRLATGWERGKDKKWRYETSDLENKFDLIYKTIEYKKLNPDYAELETKLDEGFNQGNVDRESILSPMDLQLFDAYQDQANEYYYKDNVKLKDILDAPELYKAYPELKEMDIYFNEKAGEEKAAFVRGFDLTDKKPVAFIEVNEKPNSYNESTIANILLHEIQHAIQRYEGFAVGGSPETATEVAQKAYDAFHITWFYDQIEDQYNKNKEKYSYNQIALLDDIKKEYADADAFEFLPSEEIMTKAFNYWVRGYGIEEQQKIVEENELDRYLPHVDKEGYWNYRRLAGEVEARNVQRRANLTVEERRNQLLSETEDKNRASQLVTFDADSEMLFQEAERDKEYEEAVNSGNTGKAIQMLKQKAEANGYSSESDYQGTSAFNGAAPSANGYFSTKEERLNAIAEESFEDTETFGDYAYDNADALGFQYLIEDTRSYRFADEKRKEAISNLRSVLEKARNGEKNLTIKMFRSVPADIKETSFRPGDWITPSRLYAIDNAEVHSWDDYNIIEQEVPLEEIWWDGNDIAEWGYDDESSNNAFKNVPNNRKKLEITYDKTGNLIPLSERFNEKNPSILFQEAGPVESENFKNWFGDWQNDPENASKVVDENGKPLAVYHGTNSYIPDIKKFKKGSKGYLGPGMYFTNSKSYASRYTNYGEDGLMQLYLNMRKPLEVNTDNPAKEILKAIYGDKADNVYKKREQKDDRITNIINASDVKKLQEAGYDGVIWKLTDDIEYMVFEPIQVKSATNNNGDFSTSNPSILFQTAYHGSAADFDQFNTKEYGYSGEGSMSFGYGTYVTGSEEIARDYAHRQAASKNRTEDLWIDTIIDNMGANKTLEEAKKESIANLKKYSNSSKSEQNKIIKKIESISDEDVKEIVGNRKLYTVEIPDSGFIKWDKDVNSRTVEKVKRELLKEIFNNPDSAYFNYSFKDLSQELNSVFSYVQGMQLYNNVSAYLEGDVNASNFFHKIGYSGIDYPAGTIYGNGEGARNFVIFNDADAKIVDKFYFQNEVNEDILNTAAGFDNWVEFMEYMQSVEADAVPEEAASDWYLNTWEIAHNVSPTSAERKAQVIADREEQNRNEKKDPVFLDGLFAHEIQKEGNLENFLKLVNKISEITDEEINGLDEEERGLVLNELKKINTVLSHPTIKTARNALIKNDSLKPKHRQRVINLMRGRIRDYRAIYADLTGRTEYAVEQSESMDAELAARARRFDLIKYDSEIENMSPEQKRALEKYVSDKEILKKFRDDKVKMDDPDVERYIEMLEGQAKNAEKMLKKARNEFQDDMQALGSMQMRDILKQYNDFLNLKSEADYRKVQLPAIAKKAVRLGERALRENQVGLSQNYNTLASNWDTFKAELAANIKTEERLRAEGKVQELLERYKKNYDATRSETVKEMMNKAESLITLKRNHSDVLNELYAVRQLKDQRKALVKRAMRRVNFSTIDYEMARKIIAIQKVFEPNLFGGVNKWIGTEKAVAREVWTAWVTDVEAHDKILNRLSLKGKTELIKRLEDTKTEEDFDLWSSKQQKELEKAMPIKDWVKTLNLDAWKEERDNAIQLDIKTVEKFRYETMRDGTKKSVPYEAAEMSPEVERMIIEALGEDMAYAIQNKSFKNWTTGEMVELTKKINNLFKQGRDKLNAKRKAEKLEADRIRNLIDQTIKDTGIVIEPDDPEDVKKAKQDKINKILGVQHAFPGTEASKREKTQVQTWLDRLLHGYHDANMRRVARILDNYDEGTVTNLLYFRENDCFNRKQRAVDRRNAKLDKVIADNKLDMRKLGNVVQFFGEDFTWDEILMFHAANLNQQDFYAEQLKEDPELEPQRAEKESAYQAIMYGNLILPEERDSFRKMDNAILEKEQERLDKLHAAELAGNQEEIDFYKMRDSNSVDENGDLLLAGTASLKALAETRFATVINGTKDICNEFKPLIDAIRADYAEEFDNINRVSIEEFNAPVWREKWYLPLIRMTAAGDTHEERVKQDLLGHSAGAGKAATERGFTKKRVKIGPMNQAPVELGLYKTWADSVDRNEHFTAYAGLVREYNRVFTSRDALGLMQDIENRYGHAMTDYIKTYIKEVANPHVTTPQKGLDKVMRIMRGNTAPAYLGWKFSSILKQGIESPAPFMQFINPAEYMHAAMRMATSKEVRDAIEDKSAFMKSRVFDPMVDLINENVEKSMNKPNYLLKKFQQAGMSGLEWIDWACVAPGWLAIYDKEYRNLQSMEQALYEQRVAELREQNETRHMKYRMTEEEIHQQAMDDVSRDIEEAAVLKADDCVRLCQPSNRNVDLSPMFKNNSEAAKAVLQFQTALNVIWQNIRYDIPYAVRKKEWKQVVGMILGYVMAGVISGVVCSGLLKDDDEPEDTAKKLGYYATTQFLDSFPIVGGNLDRLAEKAITGEGGTMFGSSLWPTFDKYYNAASSLISKDYEKALKNVASGLAITLGFPLSGTKEAMRAVGVGDGDGEIELKPEALAGRKD